MPARRDLSLDYLRTTLTLMVLAHHSSLAYTTFAYFDKVDLFRSTAPVVDAMRWRFLDYAENFNDVFFMSLMFFVSGLFVWPAMVRHGLARFTRDRLLRLGLPFAVAVVGAMPLAYYVQWMLTGRSAGFVDFWVRLAHIGFAVGPPWFVWVLLLFDLVLAALVVPWLRRVPAAGEWMERWQERPVPFALAVTVLAAAAYLPLLFRYGFGTWTNFITSPFSFQVSRIALYALWFLLGFLVGIPGLASGLLAREGALARRWPLCLAGCFLAYNALWFIPRWDVVRALPAFDRRLLEAALWVVSCAASCFGFLALFRGTVTRQRPWMDSLTRSAYIMYLVHYVFITWTQYALLDLRIHAGLKFLCVFLATTLASWLTAQVLLRIPRVKSIL